MRSQALRWGLSALMLVSTLAPAFAGSPTVGEIEADRARIVGKNLPLTQAEAEPFWPLYFAYREELEQIELRGADLATRWPRVLDTESPISVYQVDQWLAEMLSVHEQTEAVRQKYVKKFRKILPARKILQLMLLEYRLDAIVEHRRTEGIYIESGGTTP